VSRQPAGGGRPVEIVSPDCSVRHLQQIAGEADEIFEPERLEPQFRAKLPEFRRHRVIKKVIACDDGDRRRRLSLTGLRPELSEKAKSVNEGHPEIQDDRVGLGFVRGAKTRLGIKCRSHVKAFKRQHARKRLCDAFVIVYDEDGRSLLRGSRS
jgi:hypothetical protein